MFKLNKKVLIAVLLLLAVVSVTFVIYKIRTGGTSSLSEKFNQKLNIPNYFQASDFKIENNIKKSDFKFPQSLPYLKQTVGTPIGLDAARKIASSLDLPGDPLTISGISKENTFIWNGDKYSLIITQNTSTVEVISSISARILVENRPNLKISDDSYYTDLAQDFLTGKIGIDPSDLNFAGFSYFKIENGVESLVKGSKEDADIIQLNYYKGNVALPVLTVNPDESQIYIQFLKDGTLISLKASLGSDFQNSEIEYPLKNYDQFSKEIGNSIIVSLNDNNVNLPDLKSSDISEIQVNSLSLAYLLSDPKEQIVQPVFLVGGTAKMKEFSEPVNILMYLPAFEGFSQP